MTLAANNTPSPWPHRLAVLLACATFPVIWVGGLVTTYDAGMAFPDWPTTHGYNVFLYPWQTWLSGPWDLFIEHGHRLLVAGIVGPVMLAEVMLVYRCERRAWVRRLTWAAALLVVIQAVLGGMRVLLDERLLAQIHACIGPAFFALAGALATVTSQRWQLAGDNFASAAIQNPKSKIQNLRRLPRLACTTAALAYIQILLGSQLRHVQVTADATLFRVAVWFHLLVAVALSVHIVLLWMRSWREAQDNGWLRRPADLLLTLIGLQLALGCGAWIVNYGWPAWLSEYSMAAGYVVRRESFLQATVTTAHVAVGSLILAVAVVLSLRAWRTQVSCHSEGGRHRATGVATAAPTAARRCLGEAQFAICNSLTALLGQCRSQIASCKLWYALRAMEDAT
jgi:cytochrome c oxidase assembly protein subunit 15